MLETIRQHSRSFLIYILFGILIMVFVLFFGQTGPDQLTCSSPTRYVARVGNSEISDKSWRFAVLGLNLGSRIGTRKRNERVREQVVDALIERELLAQAANAWGFRVSDAELHRRVAGGEFYVLGIKRDGKPIYYNDDGAFDDNMLTRFARNLNLSIKAYLEEQRQEMLAKKMRDAFILSMRVSPQEVLDAYRTQNNTVSAMYVKFQPRSFASGLEVTAAEIDAYVAEHDKELRERWEIDKALYQGRRPEVRVRHIVFKRDPEAPQAKLALARRTLARAKAGQNFAALAKQLSEHDSIDPRGDLRWRPADRLQLGANVDQAVKNLKPGQVSKLIEADDAYTIVKIETRREGDLTYDAVKADFGEEKLRREKPRELAQKAADEALKKAIAGTKLADLFVAAEDATDTDKNKPQLVTANEIRRNGDYVFAGPTNLAQSAELANALFDKLSPNQLAPKVFEADDEFIIIKLLDRQEPDLQAFQEEKATLSKRYTQSKGSRLLSDWSLQRCQQSKANGALQVHPSYLDYGDIDDKTGQPIASTYKACAPRPRGFR